MSRNGQGHNGDRLWWIAVTALVVFVLLLWFHAAPLGNIHTGDTDNLVKGTRRALACLRDDVWSACGLVRGTRFSDVFPYPALQYIPAAVLVSNGRSDAATVTALARLNIIAFAVTISLCAWAFAGADRRAPRALAIIAVLASSAVYQSTAGFGEMLAAAIVAAAVVTAIKRRPVLIFITIALAAIGKDTLLPFVVVLGFLCAREEGRLLPCRSVLAALVAGAVLGGVLVVTSNEFRFGQPINVFYLDPLFRTPGTQRKLVFFAGEWLSPSAGLLWYWPVATGALVVCAAMTGGRFMRQPSHVMDWFPGFAIVSMTIAFTAGLAAWYSPFGWIAYGPRLSVPLMPGLVIAALHVAGTQVETTMRRVLRTVAGLTIVSALCVSAGWPQFGSAWSFAPAIQDLIAGDETCPAMMDTPIQQDSDRYFSCTQHTMWRLHSLPIDEAATEGGGVALLGRLLLITATVALLVHARNIESAEGRST